MDLSCSFLILVLLSHRTNLGQEVLGSTPFMYAIEASSAVLLFRGTVMK